MVVFTTIILVEFGIFVLVFVLARYFCGVLVENVVGEVVAVDAAWKDVILIVLLNLGGGVLGSICGGKFELELVEVDEFEEVDGEFC